MKKTIIAFVLGFGLATAGSVYAQDVTATFSKFVFKVNGDEKKLDADPLVYQGTTYLPVRVVSNLLGYDVTYKSDSRTIELNDTEVSRVEVTTETPVSQEMTPEDSEALRSAEEQIPKMQQRIAEKEARITEYENEKQSLIDKLTQTLDQNEKELISGQVSVIEENIRVARESISENEKAIESTQAYIAKIKAKYEQQ